MALLTFTQSENRKAEVLTDQFELHYHRKVERKTLVIATNQPRGHAHPLFQFNHRSHEGDVGGKSRVEGLVGYGPGKQRAPTAAAFPGKFRRAALCAHIARQVAEAAAIAAALEIEMAVLALLPEFLLNRVLWARSRLGWHHMRGRPHFGGQIAFAAHANLLRMAMLPSPRSPQPVTRPVWAPSTWRSPQS